MLLYILKWKWGMYRKHDNTVYIKKDYFQKETEIKTSDKNYSYLKLQVSMKESRTISTVK